MRADQPAVTHIMQELGTKQLLSCTERSLVTDLKSASVVVVKSKELVFTLFDKLSI